MRLPRVASRNGGMSRIGSTSSLRSEGDRADCQHGLPSKMCHLAAKLRLPTLLVLFLLACVAISGVFGYGWPGQRVQDRREITVRGMFLTSSTQHSSQQARSAALAVNNEPVSLDDIDTVLSNLEGLCSEEQSWATQDAGLEQCIQAHNLEDVALLAQTTPQGPWNGAAESTEGVQLARSSSSASVRSSAPRPQRSPVGPSVPSSSSRRGLASVPAHLRGGHGSRAAVPPMRKLSESSECSAALGIPKVALLFLTAGDMPLEEAWATWLRPTAGVLRVDCLAKRVCNAPDEHAMLQGVNEACAPRNDTLSHLFSIYIHPSPTFKGYSRGSIFRGREISPRIKVEWGHWSIVEAQRLLLRSALQDPLNQRFVFLSETCAPLIPAATMYAQLMSEPKSRINACRKPDWDLNLDRWNASMEQGHFRQEHWRKSAQWSALVRKHAQVVADDVQIADVFSKTCRAGIDAKSGIEYKCVSDEHYVPSLLALKGLEDETDCSGSMTYVHWWGDGEHMQPETFNLWEVSGDLVEQMRMSDFGCENAQAIASAPNVFTTMGEMATKRCNWQPSRGYPHGLLGPSCHLFARKWDKWTGDAMMDLLELETSLGMLDGRTGACQWPKPDLAAAVLR